MRVHKEQVLPVRLVGLRQLLPEQFFLHFAHIFERVPILLVQHIIAVSQRKTHEDLRSQTRHDGCFAAGIRWSLAVLEGLSSQSVFTTERNKRQRIGCHFLAVAGQIRSMNAAPNMPLR
jgi:hypothetical protein